jgi:hypothetical protein
MSVVTQLTVSCTQLTMSCRLTVSPFDRIDLSGRSIYVKERLEAFKGKQSSPNFACALQFGQPVNHVTHVTMSSFS